MTTFHVRLFLAVGATVGLMAATVAAEALPAQTRSTDALAAIRDEGLTRSHVMESLTWLTDVFGGRLTGSPAAKAAAGWTEARLRQWQIPVVYRETWTPLWPRWTNEVLWIRAVRPQPFPIIAISA